MDARELLHGYAVTLAARDGDYALVENGLGFSKPDTWAGHALAETPVDQWTPEIEAYAYTLLRKYASSQLRVDWSTVPLPALADTNAKPAAREQLYRGRGKALAHDSLTVSLTADGYAKVEFSYDADLVASVKQIAGRHFDGATKAWMIPPTSFHALDVWCDENAANVDEALSRVFTVVATEPIPEALPERRVERDGKNFRIFFPYDPAVVSQVKAMGARFSRTPEPHWTLAASKASALLALTDFTMPDGLAEAAAEVAAERESLRVASAAVDTDEVIPGYEALFPFQRAGVAYALRAKRVIIGDDMGLGKTVQALATVAAADAYPLLVICPALVKPNWAREVMRWSPGKRVSIVNGKKVAKVRLHGGGTADVPVNDFDADILIINYDLLTKHKDALAARPWRSVVMDEAHYVKNSKAARTKVAASLAKLPSVEYVIGLTGTPVLNRPVELTSPLDIIGILKPEFGGFFPFAKRYCAAYQDRFGWRFDGASNLEELHTRLRETCYIRRDKRDVLTELPAKTRVTQEIPLADPKAYARCVGQTVEWLRENGTENHADTLAQITLLRQEAARQKLPAMIEWITETLEETDEKLLVFAHHREIQRALYEAFPTAARIFGDDQPDVRDANVARFQEDETCRLMVASIGAGGVGVTLTAASYVAFAELPWRPGDVDQAEDRAYGRLNDPHPITSFFLLGQDTIDFGMADLIDSKREVVDTVTSGKSGASGGGILKALVASLLGPDD